MNNSSVIEGVLNYEIQNEGSKSEGKMAILKCSDGKEYILHRKDVYPINDDFFAPYHGTKLKVEGQTEDSTNYFCVISVYSENNDELKECK